MSDERRTGSIFLFAERQNDCVPAAGSPKRKLGQTVPISRYNYPAYPSPPMSNPPSPPGLPSKPSLSPIAEPRTTTTSISLPLAPSEQVATSFPSAAQQAGQSTFAEQAPSAPALERPSSGLQVSSGPIGAFQSGQNVFSIGSTASGSAGQGEATGPRVGRKAKAHVASACMNCKRAHLSCDTQRPCTRCVASGKQDTCFDVPHKKRGRPRLREETEFKVEQMLPEQTGRAPVSMAPVATPASTAARPMARTRHQRTESLRSLRSQGSEGSSSSSLPTPGFPPILQPGWVYQPPRPPSSGISAALIPTAFLDLDFNFIRANRPFQQILCNDQDVRGRQLQDLVTSADGESFITLRGRLKGEREAREPAHMPPILQPGEDPIQGVMEDDIERLATGFSDQTYTWTRAGAGPHRETFPARVRLAKATAYFVVVTLPSFRPVEMLPAQSTQSMAPQGFMVPPPPRSQILPSQPPGSRPESQSAPPGPYLPQSTLPPATLQQPFVSPGQQPTQPRTYPSIQPYPQQQQPPPPSYAAPPPRPPHQQQQQQPTTPRLPTAEPPMQITPLTPLTPLGAPSSGPPRHHHRQSSSLQLPPLGASGTPGSLAAGMPATGRSTSAEAQQQQQQQQTLAASEDDDEESPKKRRRMDISDVLQR